MNCRLPETKREMMIVITQSGGIYIQKPETAHYLTILIRLINRFT